MQPSSAAWGLPAPWGHHYALHGQEPTHFGGVLIHVHVDPACSPHIPAFLRFVVLSGGSLSVSRAFDKMVDCRCINPAESMRWRHLL